MLDVLFPQALQYTVIRPVTTAIAFLCEVAGNLLIFQDEKKKPGLKQIVACCDLWIHDDCFEEK